MRDDAVAAAALPVAQAGSGLSGLRALWRTLDRAPFSAKLPHQLAYGAAAEKDGDAAEAERAYRTVMSAPLSVDGLTHLAARVRLAKLLDESGRKDEAAKVREQTGRLLSGADAGVVDALDHTL
ncbi:MAG: hypothetical protein R3F14_26800 [Polyangiaceae bacterium]